MRVLPATLVLWLTLAGSAWAGAGSGSSGFGGGGGGGFSGGGSSGGSCTGGNCSGSPIVLLVVVAIFAIVVLWGMWKAARMRKRRRERDRVVRLASAEAADDDPAFAADAVLGAAAALFRDIQAAWDARDRARLRDLVGADLLVEWERRLDDFDRKGWHNRVAIRGRPQIQYVGLENRAEDAADRVTVFIAATLTDYVEDRDGHHVKKKGSSSETTQCREYWTLAKRDGGWRLESIQQEAEGAHVLESAIVATPWGDDQALHDEAVAERAAAEAAPAGVSPGELADLDFDGPARAAALDLALADGRFDPDLIEASVRRAVGAWAQAVDGADAPLEAVARPEVVTELLYPGDGGRRTRLVVRGPRIDRVRITALDAAAQPPAITVELHVRGRRYVEDRDTAAVLLGLPDRDTAFTERWAFTLDGPPEWPWRLASAGAVVPS